MKKRIRIGTRKSRLAMVQTELVIDQINARFPDLEVEVVPMSTKGDQILNKSLASFGGKGVFTKELEQALLSGEIDLAVHSAKDMPMELPDGLHIGAVLHRADPRDVLVTMNGVKASDLPEGSVIGTSSLRREIQIQMINPSVRIKVLRGNVQTRLQKLKDGLYDGILLAAAGISRLGYEDKKEFHYEYLDIDQFLPAAGQGILVVESRKDDLTEVLEAIHCDKTAQILEAERSFLEYIEGSCNAPAASYCCLENNQLNMKVMFQKPGADMKKSSASMEFGKARELGESLAKAVNQGTVYLVGAGPGDTELITMKAMQLIKEADVIVYDNLISASILNEADRKAELIYAGKRASNHHMKQEDTNRLLVQKALEGKDVVRLKGGDPFIFGRGGEEARVLKEHGITFEIVPGISSSYAVPAYAGIPVTDRSVAASFHVITGHEGNHKKEFVLDYSVLAKESGTLVFLMGLSNLEQIVKNLVANGKSEKTKAAVIQEGTMPGQRCAVGTLETIVEKVKQMGIRTPAVTVIGDVAGFHQDLDWFGKKKRSGKQVLITGTKNFVNKISPKLKSLGAHPVAFSLIETMSIISGEYKEVLGSLDNYNWIVFTSSNGVEIFFDSLYDLGVDLRKLSGIKFAVIGEGTKDSLMQKGIFADFVPTKFTSKDMADEWIPGLDKQDHILLLRAKEASTELPEALKEAGIFYRDIPVYETRRDDRKAEELNRVVETVDYIVLASSSAVQAYNAMLESNKEVKARLLSIGPVTSKTALDNGLSIYKTAKDYSADGIIDLLREEL